MTQNTGMDDNERETLIYNTGLEEKYLLEVVDDYKSARRHIRNDKRRIEIAMTNTSKACIYWREVDTVEYGEYIVTEMVGKTLLEEYNSTER